MAFVTLNDVRGIGDPLRIYNYDLVITEPPGATANGQVLRISNTNTSIPGVGVESFESNHHGHTLKHPGRGIHPRTLTAEYEERSNGIVLTTLRAWRELAWNTETGAQAVSADLKVDGFLELYDTEENLIKTIRIRGMYVEDIADTPLDGATSDSVKVTVTFSYDNTIDEG